MAELPADRRFNDREVALILKTAVELQAQEPVPAAARGLSLAELEQLAGEVGLDGALIRRAAREVEARGARSGAGSWLGAASEIVVEREIDGDASVAAHEAVLLELRQATGAIGEASTVGRVFGWRGRKRKARVEAHVASDGGRTRIRLRVALTEPALDVFGGYMTLGGVGGFTVLAFTINPLGALGAALGAGVAGVGYAVARWRFAEVAAEHRAWAATLADRLAACIADRAAAAGALPGVRPNAASMLPAPR